MERYSRDNIKNNSILTIAYNMTGAVEAARQGRFVVIVDVIDMSTTLEAVWEAGAVACFGACPSGKTTPCPTNPFLMGRIAAREAMAQGAPVAVITEPRTGSKDTRVEKAAQVIAGLKEEGLRDYELMPNLGAETAFLTCWRNKVAIAVTEAGGAVFDAVWQTGGGVSTATVARTLRKKGKEPALAGLRRAFMLAGGQPLTLVAASSNALEDVLAVQYLAGLIVSGEVDWL